MFVAERRQVQEAIEKEIREYIDGEERAQERFKELGLKVPADIDLVYFVQMKDKAVREAGFEAIRAKAERISREAKFEDFI
jgi:hypothetical protein